MVSASFTWDQIGISCIDCFQLAHDKHIYAQDKSGHIADTRDIMVQVVITAVVSFAAVCLYA